MIQFLKNQVAKFRTQWFRGVNLERPLRWEAKDDKARHITQPSEALSLPAFWAALRLYQFAFGSMPCVTYRHLPDGGRDRARNHYAYKILHSRPNPAQTAAVFWQMVIKDIFLEGDNFTQLQFSGNNQLKNMFRIPPHCVLAIYVDDEWNKAYMVNTGGGPELIPDEEMAHTFLYSENGIRGTPFLHFAGQSLGLHKEVQDSASAYYKNGLRTRVVLKYDGKLEKAARDEVLAGFREKWQGSLNTGEVPIIGSNTEIIQLNGVSAEDTKLIEALSSNKPDVGNWWGLTPLMLGDLSRGTYSNLGADNTSFYQKSIAPLNYIVEMEYNNKIFGPDGEYYCEFNNASILRGDPIQQATVFKTGIEAGYYQVSEVREWQNLSPIPEPETDARDATNTNTANNPDPDSLLATQDAGVIHEEKL